MKWTPPNCMCICIFFDLNFKFHSDNIFIADMDWKRTSLYSMIFEIVRCGRSYNVHSGVDQFIESHILKFTRARENSPPPKIVVFLFAIILTRFSLSFPSPPSLSLVLSLFLCAFSLLFLSPDWDHNCGAETGRKARRRTLHR